ncbi:MAG: outer membrane lipoprotein-sorting protein [Bacteroidales bacterium]|nr:outer membrane lipoprotein-sorting protein [Bacteroidales bacterium]
MKCFSYRAGVFARLFFLILALAFAGARPVAAQRLFHVDVQTKTVNKGKMRAADKGIWYTRGGNLNIEWRNGARTYYYVSTPYGFTDVYYPSSKEVTTLDQQMFNPSDELLWLFAEGGIEDMGLAREGFVLKSFTKDGDYTVRRYEPRKSGGMCTRVDVAFDSDYLPVYCAYFDKKGRILTKTYLSDYTSVKGFAFPMRVTEISYLLEKNDSTVRLDLYRGLEIDEPADMFGFRVPSDAKRVDMKEGLKAAKKNLK